jgi:two-component system, NtrC family, sensor histidine kinase KinB
MANTVKQKIRYGAIFLFLLFMVMGGVSVFHILRLQNDSKIILKNNYESLDYTKNMLCALDSIQFDSVAYIKKFGIALSAQEVNITENGEQYATNNIRALFNRYTSGNTADTIAQQIRSNIYAIIKVNMYAIETKNNAANKTASKAVSYITLIASIILIISLTFSFNFPSIIIDPINKLTEGIAEISSKNYKHRIHLKRKDEFGQMADAFNAMAGRLEYFENSNLNRIIFEKTRAEAVINSLKDASIGIDRNNRVLFANDQALQLLGLKAMDMVDRPVEEITKKNDLFGFLMEEKNNMPFKIVVDNRENYFVKEVVDITRDESNGKVIVLKNITSFKELDVAKNNFIATISHELKTPLASSDFSLKLLQDDRVSTLTAEQQELVENLKRDNQRMLRILSELLNISQVEAGKIQLQIKHVSPYQIVDGAIDAILNSAREKGITVKKDYDKQLPDIMADSEKTNWVLNNLLINAIKYSKKDQAILVSLRKKNTDIIFSVKDEGPGIPEEYRSKVFDRFFKVPGSNSPGTGLGLAISKEFIEAQEGNIWVESIVGLGSTFSFSFMSV